MTMLPPLSFAAVSELLSYDPVTGVLLWKVGHGNMTKPGDVAGTMNDRGYLVVSFKGKGYRAHRLAWVLHHGEFPIDQIDHINGNRADNSIGNLRIASSSQNSVNRVIRKQSGLPRGVYHSRPRGRYRAVIRVDGVSRHLGMFATVNAAQAAYQAAAGVAFGEFARCE